MEVIRASYANQSSAPLFPFTRGFSPKNREGAQRRETSAYRQNQQTQPAEKVASQARSESRDIDFLAHAAHNLNQLIKGK